MRKLLFNSLVQRPLTEMPPAPDEAAMNEIAAAFRRTARRRLGRSLSIRELDAGSCNGCELEIHALNNAYYDVERFGIRFVASPRHADVLLITGPVTRNIGAQIAGRVRPARILGSRHKGRCPPTGRRTWKQRRRPSASRGDGAALPSLDSRLRRQFMRHSNVPSCERMSIAGMVVP